MKIAIFTSSRNVIPPIKTGGVEFSTYYLVRELARRGHEITLYAGLGSKVEGVKVKNISSVRSDIELEFANLEERIHSFHDNKCLANFFLNEEWREYDLIQSSNYLFYQIIPYARFCPKPIIVRINYPHQAIYPYLKAAITGNDNVYYLPVSDFIKTTMPGLDYMETIYPTIDFNDFPLAEKKGDYALCIGRISPEKGTHLALRAALIANEKLVIAGAVSRSHRPYFNKKIKPYIDNEKIKFIGEIDMATKIKVYQRAKAVLFPIQWNEPFGMVMLESMACGTPVIAFNRAAVKEVINDGENGLVVNDGDCDLMAKAIAGADSMDRRAVRNSTIMKFNIQVMAEKYEKICQKIILK